MFGISAPPGLCHILLFYNLPMVQKLQIKVAKEWRSLKELLDTPVVEAIKQFDVFCFFSSYTQHQAHYQSDHQNTSNSVHMALLLSRWRQSCVYIMFSYTKLAKQR